MTTLKYTGSTGQTVEFDLSQFIRTGETDTLRSRTWSRTLGFRNYTNLSRPARELQIEVFSTLEAADNARRVFEFDMANNTPGTIEMNGWSQRVLVPESTTDLWRMNRVSLQLTCALLDGVWRKPTELNFPPLIQATSGSTGKGYPFAYEYDYSPVVLPNSLEQPGYLSSPAKITIFGAVTNPSITIGENIYEFTGNIPSGAYLVIDGVNTECYMVNENGFKTNEIDGLNIGTGEGSGHYPFEPIKPGYNSVSYDGSFGFTLEIYQEESEVPWLS